jgi:hypothetical protein
MLPARAWVIDYLHPQRRQPASDRADCGFIRIRVGVRRRDPIVRLNARPLPAAVSTWLGDSIARWEGDVLVVQTRGFTPRDHLRAGGAQLSSFRREPSSSSASSAWPRTVSDHTFVVEDPIYYTQPGTGESQFLS